MLKVRRFGTRKGTAIVEFALVLPILVLLLVGLVEFSRVLSVKQVITNATREGARAGAVELNDALALSVAQSVSENYLESSGADLISATIVPSFVETGGSEAIQVVIDYNYDSLLTGWIPGIPSMLTLRSAALMRRES